MEPAPMPGDPSRTPRFDLPVPDDGYAWWYVDATSDDGRHGLTAIAFVGSVFSPYYAHARRRGPAAAEAHCAFNVALYGEAGRWAMTERDAASVTRSPTSLAIGPSRMEWRDDGVLVLDIDEWTMPWPTRLRGQVRITPSALTSYAASLDPAGRHHWRPIAPVARVEVEFTAPEQRWSGHAYVDSNAGDEPLEARFRHWHWSRSRQTDGTTCVCYDVERRDGSRLELGLAFAADGSSRTCPVPAPVTLPSTLWRITRQVRLDGTDAASLRAVEDTPFYARSMTLGAAAVARPLVHESLDLDRFDTRWVQLLLPFRMPRLRSRRSG